MTGHEGPAVRFAIMGPARVWRGEDEVDLGPVQQRALLALLMARAGDVVSTDEMTTLLWRGDPPADPVNAIYRHVGVLRRLLQPQLPVRSVGRWLLRESSGYRLAADVAAVDLLRFRDQVRRARQLARAGDAEQAVAIFREALDLRSGSAASGLPTDIRAHSAFAAVDSEYLAAVKHAADAALACAAGPVMVPVLHRVAAEHPLDEAVQARLVLCLAASGQRAEALDMWHEVRRVLADELGVPPGAELRDAQQKVLVGTVVPAAREGAANTGAPPQGEAPPTESVRAPGFSAALAPRPSDSSGGVRVVTRPAQLPPDLAPFAGRQRELDLATGFLSLYDGSDATAIVAIQGMAGVGKSTTAVHWARQVAHRFPDGQLYVNLRGFEPGAQAVDPGDAIRVLLEALGVTADQIPAALNARVSLYRTLLADRRILVFLDNARDAVQVRPLLPGGGGCLVLVTSRDRLLGLAAVDGARIIQLGLLSDTEARELLTRRLGEARLAAEPAAAADIIATCAGLPLALALVASRAAARPRFPLSAVVAELRGSRHGLLDTLRDRDPMGDLEAVLSWSYDALSRQAARVLRLTVLHPGPDITRSAVASLGGVGVREADRLLHELVRTNMLVEHRPGRFTCHDLLREYAAKRIAHDSAAERSAAGLRLLDHYVCTARTAAHLLSPWWVEAEPMEASAGVVCEEFADAGQALVWFSAERVVLRELVAHAARKGAHGHVWRLAWAMERFLDRQGHANDAVKILGAGLSAALREGNRSAQAHLHRALARANTRLGRHGTARRHIRTSLTVFAEIGDSLGLAHAHRCHGWIMDQLGRYEASLGEARQALVLYRSLGNRVAEISALHALGWTHLLRGEPRLAEGYFARSITSIKAYRDPYAEASAWYSLGCSRQEMGRYDAALECYRTALAGYRDGADHYNEATVLDRMGDALRALGDPAAAHRMWADAIDVMAQFDGAATAAIRAKRDADSVPEAGLFG
ncbi:BTAD domain-containing putative transcriptional regulator [Streptomyces shenzhenensis]|uniref:AfsR/SARP family transcriptional regulator n=1 Tax=Streptomyces shenzhenensis TaxID=943815 RepID=UPI0036AF3C10